MLIVGEGRETEYNYFVGFRNAFEVELNATGTSLSVARGKGGDARRIVKNAVSQARAFKPDRKRGDRVFLLLDTEGPGRAPELPGAEKLAEKHSIEIVYSCPAFEYWLLCHFSKCPRNYFKSCDDVITTLDKKWKTICKTRYDKSDKDIFDRLSAALSLARSQALSIDLSHQAEPNLITPVNPSTQVYELISILVGARTGEKCPITGNWKLISETNVQISLEKGDTIPAHAGEQVHWRL